HAGCDAGGGDRGSAGDAFREGRHREQVGRGRHRRDLGGRQAHVPGQGPCVHRQRAQRRGRRRLEGDDDRQRLSPQKAGGLRGQLCRGRGGGGRGGGAEGPRGEGTERGGG